MDLQCHPFARLVVPTLHRKEEKDRTNPFTGIFGSDTVAWRGREAESMREPTRELVGQGFRSQRGVSLVEVLVVIAVIVPVILAATLGLLTSARLATNTKTSQELNAAGASFAESLKNVAYVDCASTTDYDGTTGLWEPPPDSDIVIDILAVEYWDQASADYASTCTSDAGGQLITIELTVLEGEAQISVVKRDPAAVPGP